MTEGRRLLLLVLQRTTGRSVASRCRVTATRVSAWASGRTKPSPEARLLLEQNYTIPPATWDRPVTVTARNRLTG